MKLKNLFVIVLLTTLFSLGAVNTKVDADDVTKENIATPVVAQNLRNVANNTSENFINKQIVKTTENELDFIKTIYEKEILNDYRSCERYKDSSSDLIALSANTNSYTKAELRLLSALIFCEAGSEPYAGKVAVGVVTVNRKKSKQFPNTLKGVIYQKNQYTPARTGALKKALKRYDAGKFTSKAEKDCIKAAKAALNGTRSVTYKGKTRNLKGYYFFSRYLRGCRLKIGGHQFK